GGVARAVRLVPLDDKSRVDLYAERVHEMLDPLREPAAAAVLVRAVARHSPSSGAVLGCHVLERKLLRKDAKDLAAREVLVEAAALAVARGRGDCSALVDALGDDWCVPWLRCAD